MIRITMDKSRKSQGVFFKDMTFAHTHCQGEGAELNAAAHNPFGLKGSINVFIGRNVEAFQEHQLRMCGAYAEVDAYGLEAFPDDSFDYVLSAHVLDFRFRTTLPHRIASIGPVQTRGAGEQPAGCVLNRATRPARVLRRRPAA